MEYCPDCVMPLKAQSKKLGHLSRWIVCPKCGYRTRQSSEDWHKYNEYLRFCNRQDEDNKTGGMKKIEENLDI